MIDLEQIGYFLYMDEQEKKNQQKQQENAPTDQEQDQDSKKKFYEVEIPDSFITFH